jgi:lysozyme
LQFIAGWEGCRLNLYDDIPERCPDRGNCTIGLGHLVHRGCCDGREEGRPFAGGITENEAWAWLRTDVETAARDVRTAVQVPLTQHQFDALVSLAYNIGGPRFAESDLLFRLNDGDYASVPDELMVFVYQPGHLRRRQQEGWMFVSSVYMLNPIFCR